jgi:hypothetical protein
VVQQPSEGAGLPIGDARRIPLARAVAAVLLAVIVFMAFELPVKQFLSLYDHAPWHDDPYDAVTSFTIFFVPLIAVVTLVRVLLCRSTQALPLSRVQGVLRGSRVALLAMVITVLTDWISVALQGNRAAWSGVTAPLVVLLGLVTAVVLGAGILLRRAAASIPPEVRDEPAAPDWFSDVVALAHLHTRWLGPLARVARTVIDRLDRDLVTPIRRFPIAAAALAALVFGVLLALNTLLREGSGPALWIDVVVGSSGMFAFLVSAGAYVGLVRSGRPAAGPRRRVIDATVLGCLAVPVALAFRQWLWWAVGSDAGSPERLGELLAVAAISTAIVVFAAETLLRVHHRVSV